MKKSKIITQILLLFSLPAFSQITDRVYRNGFWTEATHVEPLSNGRWLVGGTGQPLPGAFYHDSVFVSILDDAGNTVWHQTLSLPFEERHFLNQILPLPDGGFLVSAEATLCDVLGYIGVLKRFDSAGNLLWEESSTDLPRDWQLAPDGNVIGLNYNELWKLNSLTGAVIWQTEIFPANQGITPVTRFALVPGSENFIALGTPAFSFWRQFSNSGGTPVYVMEKSNDASSAFWWKLKMRPNGKLYMLTTWDNSEMATINSDMQFEMLTPQIGRTEGFDFGPDGIYFIAREGPENRVYKTDFNGNFIQNLTAADKFLKPQGIAVRGSKIALAGLDGSGPKSFPGGPPLEYAHFDASNAWTRIGEIGNQPAPETADVGVTEVLQQGQFTVEKTNLNFDPFHLYDFSGGDFRLKITNHGSQTLNSVWANIRFDYGFWGICFVAPAKQVFFENLNLLPGESVWVDFGDVSAFEQEDLPTQLCFWTSGPNGRPDFEKSNDHACLEVVLGGKNVAATSLFSVFPNPVSGGEVLKIELAENFGKSTLNWRISDALGRVLKNGDEALNGRFFEIPVAGLPVGIYFLSVENQAVRLVID